MKCVSAFRRTNEGVNQVMQMEDQWESEDFEPLEEMYDYR